MASWMGAVILIACLALLVGIKRSGMLELIPAATVPTALVMAVGLLAGVFIFVSHL
jgi:hypothetical protein